MQMFFTTQLIHSILLHYRMLLFTHFNPLQMTNLQQLIQAHSILSKSLISKEDIIEVKRILNEEIQLQEYENLQYEDMCAEHDAEIEAEQRLLDNPELTHTF